MMKRLVALILLLSTGIASAAHGRTPFGASSSRRIIPMPNRRKFVRQMAAVLLACGLIACLLPGFAAAQDLSTLEERMQWLFERLTEEDHRYRTDGALQSPQVLVSLYLSDGQDEAALEHIATAMEAIAAATDPTPARGGDIGGQVRTAAPALVRALYRFGDHFSANQLERIKTAVTGEVFTYRMRGHGTENHAMDFVSALYLLPQYFPDATWSVARLVGREFAIDGRQTFTSQQMMDEARDKILRRGRGFYRVGHQELLSTTYDVLSARSSVNLWEFARDPVVRDAGEALTLYHVAVHALNNFDGHTMPPFNRRNALQMRFGSGTGSSGRLPHHGYAAWMLWGQNMIVPPDVDENQAGQFLRSTGFQQYGFGADPTELVSALLQTSGLRLPGALNRIARGAEAPYEIRGANGEYGTWGDAENLAVLRYVWRDRNFAIGGPVAERFHPGSRPEKRWGDQQRGFYDCYEMFSIVWKSENRLRALEAMHPHWNSNQGEDHWRTTHSPFQQTGVHRNAAITMFNVPDKDPWPDRGREGWIAKRDQHFNNLIKLGQVRLPTTVNEITANEDFHFFREGDVYVAIRVLKPGHSLHEIEDVFSNDIFHVVKSREARTGFVFEVGTAEEHGSFGAFQTAVKANLLRVDWDTMEVRYTTTHGDELRFRYDTDYSEDNQGGYIKIVPDLWINGRQREVDFDNWPLAESPVMTLKDSILRITQGGEQVQVDWSGELPRISRR